jgi:hypothetical protein
MYFLMPIAGLVVAATVGYLLLETFVFAPRRWRLRWGSPIPVVAALIPRGGSKGFNSR